MIIQIETTKLAQCIWYFNGSEGAISIAKEIAAYIKKFEPRFDSDEFVRQAITANEEYASEADDLSKQTSWCLDDSVDGNH